MSIDKTLSDFITLLHRFEEMATEDRVDLTVVPLMNQIIVSLKEREDRWARNRKVRRESAFVIFHGYRNLRLILQKMRNRVIQEARLK